MTDAQLVKLLDDFTKLQSRVQAIEIQITLMSPAELLQFKGKVLQALRTIDEDLSKISRAYAEISKTQTVRDDKNRDMLQKLDLKVTSFIVKITVYATILATILTVIFSSLLNHLIGKL